MLVIGIIALVLGVSFFKNATNPDKQWEGIAKILPYDERPADMTPVWGMDIGVEQYTLKDDRGFQIQIQHHTDERARELRQKLFESDVPEIPKNMGPLKFDSPTSARVDVQGRQVHVVRTRIEFQGVAKRFVPKEAQDQMGSMLWADVTPEGRDDIVLFQMQRMKFDPKSEAPDTPISDDELRAELKPFRIGPKH
jgi:hypothetical protein